MITRHKQLRSIGLRCIEIYQNWDRNIFKEMPFGFFSKAGKKKKFLILDDDINNPGYRRLDNPIILIKLFIAYIDHSIQQLL